MEVEDRLLKFRKEAATKNQQDSNVPSLYASIKQKFQPVEKIQTPAEKNKTTKIIDDTLKRTDLQIDDSSTSSKPWTRDEVFTLALKTLLYIIFLIISIKIEFGIVYFIVSGIVIIYINTSSNRNKSGLSAYSVFNPNMERIQGTVTGEQLQNNMFGRFS